MSNKVSRVSRSTFSHISLSLAFTEFGSEDTSADVIRPIADKDAALLKLLLIASAVLCASLFTSAGDAQRTLEL